MIDSVIEMIYACDNCGFLFSRSTEPDQCPDCGKLGRIRTATAEEGRAFQARKLEDVWRNPAPVMAG